MKSSANLSCTHIYIEGEVIGKLIVRSSCRHYVESVLLAWLYIPGQCTLTFSKPNENRPTNNGFCIRFTFDLDCE